MVDKEKKTKERLVERAVEILKQIKGKGIGVCSFAFYPDNTKDNNDDFYTYPGAPCHYNLEYSRYCEIVVSDIRFSDSGHEKSKELGDKFLNWLLSEESPWGSLIPHLHGDLEFQKKFGIILTNTNFPANFVANFLVATRTHLEHFDILVKWDTLVEKGINKNLAFAVSSCFYFNEKSNVTSNSTDRGHCCFDTFGVNHVDLFVKREPKTTTQLLSESGKYRPCNATWISSTNMSYPDFIKNTYKDLIEKPKADLPKPKTRMFKPAVEMRAQRYEGNQGISMDIFLEILKLEEQRLLGEVEKKAKVA